MYQTIDHTHAHIHTHKEYYLEKKFPKSGEKEKDKARYVIRKYRDDNITTDVKHYTRVLHSKCMLCRRTRGRVENIRRVHITLRENLISCIYEIK